jgi:hypothetical protein
MIGRRMANQMIRKRLTITKQPAIASAQPRRRRLSGTPSPSIPSDERDLSTDDLAAKLRDSFLAEGRRVREAIRREIGGDVLSILQEGLKSMSSRERRRVQSFLDHRLAGR